MKKICTLLLFALFSTHVLGQFGGGFNPGMNAIMYGRNMSNASVTHNFSAPLLKEFTRAHHTVAIAPFAFKINYASMPEGNTVEATRDEEKQDQWEFKQELAIAFRDRDIKRPYTVKFQMPYIEDNSVLVDTVRGRSLDNTLVIHICKAIQVDALITGSAVVTPSKNKHLAFHLHGPSAAGSAVVTIKLYDGKTGILLWFTTVDMGIQSGIEWLDTVELGMNKIARKFPYQSK